MKVFKFGGASVKNAEAVKNVAKIIQLFPSNQIAVVVSAMGKTTNALEKLNRSIFYSNGDQKEIIQEIKDYHWEIYSNLFPYRDEFSREVEEVFTKLNELSTIGNEYSFDHLYDQIVSQGELISTKIIAEFLNSEEVKTHWQDVRECIKTNHQHREGKVNWTKTEELIQTNFEKAFLKNKVILTQGFIAQSPNGFTTTLGREGSDYTASILAYCLNAEDLTIWKDVPGVLNADPKWFDNTVKLDNLSYQDAIELAYYGASVIHPKTIQPLQQKNIPLNVKSFIHPNDQGTVIGKGSYDTLVPSFIFKMDQVVISIASKDFSFIAEDYLHQIFGTFADFGLKINLMQNSAISFLICVNNDKEKIEEVISRLSKKFKVEKEEGLELITIRYYDSATIERVTKNKNVILQQKGKRTIQLVVKDLGSGITI